MRIKISTQREEDVIEMLIRKRERPEEIKKAYLDIFNTPPIMVPEAGVDKTKLKPGEKLIPIS